jgi:hypothetical protein
MHRQAESQLNFAVDAFPENSAGFQVDFRSSSESDAMMRTNGALAKEGRTRISMEASVKRIVLALAGVIAGIQATPALAHHSFAMFDTARQVTLEGTVQEFQWTNPHAWVILSVDKKGRAEQWAVEMTGPNGLVRQG